MGVGCWAIGGPDTNLGLPMGWSTADDSESLRGLERALALGATLFDTADVYGHGRSERLIGRAIRAVPRDQVVLSSKVGYLTEGAEHPYEPAHMRRRLESTLANLGVDHVDIYFFHNNSFGDDDRWLDGAIEQMRAFQREGLVRAVGMRGPHRFVLDRLTVPKEQREDKQARFLDLFQRIRPDYIATRYNALTPTPPAGTESVFDFAERHGASVLINKPLAQGLLVGKYTPSAPPSFGSGDHRLRKAWFASAAIRVIDEGLRPLRERFGASTGDLARVALRFCLQRASNAAVLVGFTTEAQAEQNYQSLGEPLSDDDITFVRQVTGGVQKQLDSLGEVFLDELEAPR
ncbi:aldo/keto reductase [Kitasatospora cystarginea]|uniref:aldo/keto reductase n=1 Tax=Kitasatospora cystarginea TaxID=58350 RepID=UPI0031CDB5B9